MNGKITMSRSGSTGSTSGIFGCSSSLRSSLIRRAPSRCGRRVSWPRRSRRRGTVTVNSPPPSVARACATSSGPSSGIVRSKRPCGRSRQRNETRAVVAAGVPLSARRRRSRRGTRRCSDSGARPGTSTTTTSASLRLEHVDRRAPLALAAARSARSRKASRWNSSPISAAAGRAAETGAARGAAGHAPPVALAARPACGRRWRARPPRSARARAGSRPAATREPSARQRDDQRDQALLAELLALGAPGLGDAVRVDEQRVARRPCATDALLVDDVLEHAQHQPARPRAAPRSRRHAPAAAGCGRR